MQLRPVVTPSAVLMTSGQVRAPRPAGAVATPLGANKVRWRAVAVGVDGYTILARGRHDGRVPLE